MEAKKKGKKVSDEEVRLKDEALIKCLEKRKGENWYAAIFTCQSLLRAFDKTSLPSSSTPLIRRSGRFTDV